MHEHGPKIQTSSSASDGRQPAGHQLFQHILALADDAYFLGHPEWETIVADARRAAEARELSALITDGLREDPSLTVIDDGFVHAVEKQIGVTFPPPSWCAVDPKMLCAAVLKVAGALKVPHAK
ncbi:MAG: hypothetical protein M3P27_13425 [Acidobacteriota bacterium]|nr:hypothetical protein [Acidobacteriota bacterium]